MAKHTISGKVWAKKQTEEKKLSWKSVSICPSNNNNNNKRTCPHEMFPNQNPKPISPIMGASTLPFTKPLQRHIFSLPSHGRRQGRRRHGSRRDSWPSDTDPWRLDAFALRLGEKGRKFLGGWDRSWEIAWITLNPAQVWKKLLDTDTVDLF